MIEQYIIIDDDKSNNLICEYLIRIFDARAFVHIFNDPETALKFLSSTVNLNLNTVLFIDLNMPTMTGWELLKEAERLELEVLKKAGIYILSSSIEDFSEQSQKFPYVSGFLSKPLSKNKLREIAEEFPKVERP